MSRTSLATDKRPIVTTRKQVLAFLERKAETDSPSDAALIQAVKDEIEKRTSDPRFLIEVRHIGSDGKDFDPSLKKQIDAQMASASFWARNRARQFITAQGESYDEESIGKQTARDPIWVKESAEVAKAYLLAGLVGGVAEHQRIVDLGIETAGTDGGAALLSEALDEVLAFNSIAPEKKSA